MESRTTGVVLSFLLVSSLVSGCASKAFVPERSPLDEVRARAETQSVQQVTVSAAVPGPEETEQLFGLPPYDRGIQPIWLEVRNASPSPIRYAPVGTDREYFSAQEVAYVHRSGFSKEALEEMNRYFYDNMMPRRIPPGETRSGFVFTHASPGTKAFNTDFFAASRENDISFTFFVEVPGFAPDHSEAYLQDLYAPGDLRNLSREELRLALAPHAAEAGASNPGLPINVVAIGQPEEVLQALLRAGWREAPRSEASLAAEVERYDGRPADVVFVRAQRKDPSRVELRFWLTPLREEGVPVWLAQVRHTIDAGGRENEVDADLDDAVYFVLQDFWYRQGLERFAWLDVNPAVSFEQRARSGDGSEYFTSGAVAVMWLSGDTVSMMELDQLEWDTSPLRSAQ